MQWVVVTVVASFACHAPIDEARVASLAETPHAQVKARVGTHTADLVVDLGATHHFLNQSFAARHNLKLGAVDHARDANGRRMEVRRVLTRVESPLATNMTDDTYVRAGEPIYDDADGVLSPQALLERFHGIDIDFVKHRFASTKKSWTSHGTRLERCGGHYVAEVLLAGQPARLFIDSGYTYTEVSLGTASANNLHRYSAGRNARVRTPSDIYSAPMYINVPLNVDDKAINGRVAVGEHGSNRTCKTQGIIGMSHLRSCRVHIEKNGGTLACAVD